MQRPGKPKRDDGQGAVCKITEWHNNSRLMKQKLTSVSMTGRGKINEAECDTESKHHHLSNVVVFLFWLWYVWIPLTVNDFTADGNRLINLDVYRSILCAHIQTKT